MTVEIPIEELAVKPYTLKEADEILKGVELRDYSKGSRVLVKVSNVKIRCTRGFWIGIFAESVANMVISAITEAVTTASNSGFINATSAQRRTLRTNNCVSSLLLLLEAHQTRLIDDGTTDQLATFRALESNDTEKRKRRSFKSRK